ncbi:OmpA/MotB family protein [Salinicola avicenniae]|uniref:OmpA/MotB family protein n=1 Tax=Salinicola avicenniae TaxID=2916836 RepID=UPI0020734492|nr:MULTISPECIES: OmpA family protein [unclassified Salinicola]
MRNRDMQHLLAPPAAASAEDEGWLTSYLDVLTLLLTLFVLLLSIIPRGESASTQANGATSVTASTAPNQTGLEPLNEGLDPRLAGLDIPGVRVLQGQEGITLRIDDNLLFPSGQATLIAQGRHVIASLVDDLKTFDGRISVEGHTDNVPIATRRFPSNWDLSAARAIAVVRYLSAQGVDATRLRAIGYGDTRPMADNASAEGRAANRRVDILLHRAAQSRP